MGVRQVRLGELLEAVDERNADLKYGIDDVKGISITKNFIDTKADMNGVPLEPYYVVKPDDFAYVTVTSRNAEKITLAHNDMGRTFVVSSSYVVFRIRRPDLLLSDYLFMYFNRPEFDRFARFNSWGSAREIFSFADLCSISLPLPPLHVQQKYAAVYTAMKANQKAFERGAKDIKKGCEAYIEKLRGEYPEVEIGEYIEESVRTNDLGLGVDAVRGLSIDKEIIQTKADMNGVDLAGYKLMQPKQIAYVPVTSRNAEKITIALNNSNCTYIVSSSYTVFYVRGLDALLPDYLMLCLSRPEFDRYARFHSWGSARENFSFSDMCSVRLPLPPLPVQRAVADMYRAYKARKAAAARMAAMIKDVCPVLIRGSVIEGGGA